MSLVSLSLRCVLPELCVLVGKEEAYGRHVCVQVVMYKMTPTIVLASEPQVEGGNALGGPPDFGCFHDARKPARP